MKLKLGSTRAGNWGRIFSMRVATPKLLVEEVVAEDAVLVAREADAELGPTFI